ncbi:REJ domain-containing protein, partial [Baffinella frigidus]
VREIDQIPLGLSNLVSCSFTSNNDDFYIILPAFQTGPLQASCLVPAGTQGFTMQVRLSLNGIEFEPGAGQIFYYAFLPEVTGIFGLKVGPEESATTITVGNFTSPAVVNADSESVKCFAPQMSSRRISEQAKGLVGEGKIPARGDDGQVCVEYATDGQHFTTTCLATFTYYTSPSVTGVVPPSAPMGQDTMLTVYGSHFYNEPGSNPRCKFGDEETEASLTDTDVNGGIRLECSVGPLTTGKAMLVGLAFNGVYESHNSVFFARYAPAPLLPQVRVGRNLGSVDLMFYNFTDRASFRSNPRETDACGSNSSIRCGPLWSNPTSGVFPCTDLLVISKGVASLGYGASCAWKDNVTLTVTMGTEATLVPGDFLSILPYKDIVTLTVTMGTEATLDPGDLLSILPYKIRSGQQLSYYLPVTLMAVRAPINPITSPIAVLVSPYDVGPCGVFSLDASLSYNHGGRQWKSIRWAQSGGPSVINEVTGAGTTSHYLSLDPFNLFEGVYTVTVTVTNWVDQSASSSIAINRLEIDVPQVRILSPPTLATFRPYSVTLRAFASPGGCASNPDREMGYAWSLTDKTTGLEAMPGNAVGKTSTVLMIPALSLIAGRVYTASVTAKHKDAAALSAKATVTIEVDRSAPVASAKATVTIEVDRSAPVAVINGHSRAEPATKKLVLSGAQSYDPDLSPAANLAGSSTLSYEWSCVGERDSFPGVITPCVELNADFLFFPNNLVRLETRVITPCEELNADFLFSPNNLVRSPSILQPSGTLPLPWFNADYRYTFTLVVTRAGVGAYPAKSHTTSIDIYLFLDEFPQLLMQPRPAGKHNPGKALTVIAYISGAWTLSKNLVWSTTQGDVAPSRQPEAFIMDAAPSFSLTVLPDKLTPGMTYKFRASWAENTQAFAEVAVVVNSPPIVGIFTVSPSTGASLDTSFSFFADV